MAASLLTPENVIMHGEAVRVQLEWHDFDGLEDTPQTVEMQVFDAKTKAAVGGSVGLPSPAATMVVTVPASAIPALDVQNGRRALVIVFTGHFADGTKKPEPVEIFVDRGYGPL